MTTKLCEICNTYRSEGCFGGSELCANCLREGTRVLELAYAAQLTALGASIENCDTTDPAYAAYAECADSFGKEEF